MNHLNLKTNGEGQTTIEKSKIEEFKTGLRGKVLSAGEHGYDHARKIWNGMFDRKPGIIARCIGTSDVIKALNFARGNDLEISVKGGGHNSAGSAVSDGGFMLDLSLMRRVMVNKKDNTAHHPADDPVKLTRRVKSTTEKNPHKVQKNDDQQRIEGKEGKARDHQASDALEEVLEHQAGFEQEGADIAADPEHDLALLAISDGAARLVRVDGDHDAVSVVPRCTNASGPERISLGRSRRRH